MKTADRVPDFLIARPTTLDSATHNLGWLFAFTCDKAAPTFSTAEKMMSRDELRSTLSVLLEEEMGESYPDLEDERDLREGLGLDSVDVVGLVMRIEREYHIRLTMEELQEVKIVGQMLDLLEAKLAARPETEDGETRAA
jgi:acyl carrier protein